MMSPLPLSLSLTLFHSRSTRNTQLLLFTGMPSSVTLRRMALVRTDISEESITTLIVNVVPSSPILVTLMMEAMSSFESSVLTRVARRNITEDGILQSYRRENLKYHIALTGWALLRRSNVSPVRYELGSYISKDDILHSHRRENLSSYIKLTRWTL
jgi:hypothetical protein